jgi:hypothetical protein
MVTILLAIVLLNGVLQSQGVQLPSVLIGNYAPYTHAMKDAGGVAKGTPTTSLFQRSTFRPTCSGCHATAGGRRSLGACSCGVT